MNIQGKAYARAGLVGNPSDGYFGKTISFIIRDFAAIVTLTEADHFEIVPCPGDLARFDSIADFLRDQKLHGYYGGMRLIKAAVKRFHDHAQRHGLPLRPGNYTLSYDTTIPRLVGLSGSSAIVVATFRALMAFHDIQIPLHEMPAVILACEKEELGISAGLQDRVIQTFEGIVHMDFDRKLIESRGHGEYIPLRPANMPPLYVAFDRDRAEVSDVPHRNLRDLFERGDKTVVDAMGAYRDLTDRGRVALESADWTELGKIVDANFDLRRTIMNVAPENLAMVQAARAAGASAKFAGSGGAICGLYRDENHYRSLVDALAKIRCTVLRPTIFPN